MFCLFNSSRLVRTLYKTRVTSYCFHNGSQNLIKQSAVNFENGPFYSREINEKTQAKLRLQDKLTDSYKIIYRAPLKNYVKFTYYTAFSSLAVMIPLLSTSFYVSGFINFPIIVQDIEIIHSLGELCGFIAGLLLMTFQVGIVVFKYPFRIYKNSEKNHYVAVYQHILPWKQYNDIFCAGEINKVTKSIMPWKDSLFTYNNKQVILLVNHFLKPVDFDEMFEPKSKKQDCK